MLKVEQIETYGWKTAIRGMRNPKNSWDKSDSVIDTSNLIIGPNDLKLMRALANAGDDHGKFLRMINISMDITAPLYWWKEFDTYKVGTVADSCSTMHKICSKPITIDDFSTEHLYSILDIYSKRKSYASIEKFMSLVRLLEYYRQQYLKTGNKEDWWQIIQMLPSSYNQKRTIQMNYQVARHMYSARHSHKLDEWHTFCNELSRLPYSEGLIVVNSEDKDEHN